MLIAECYNHVRRQSGFFLNQVVLCTVIDNVDCCVTITFDDNLFSFLNEVVLCTVSDNVDLCATVTFDEKSVFFYQVILSYSVTMLISVLQSRSTKNLF